MQPAESTPAISVRDLRYAFEEGNARKEVLHGVSADFWPGEIVIIMGPSGSGKSTLLKLIGGQRSLQEGSIRIDGHELAGVSKTRLVNLRRHIGFIFQSHHLLSALTACQNVQMPLSFDKRQTARSSRKKALEMLARVGLEEHADKKPAALSGGQKQRVAIARALVKRPRVLLLDEPLSNLDARLRLQTREEIRRIQRQTNVTTVFVTHDQEEAMSISDEIVVMKDGVVQQIGKPQEVYDQPVNLFVAKFLGTPPIHVFDGRIEGGKLYIGGAAVLDVDGAANQPVYAAVRPEGFILAEDGPLCCKLDRVEVMGRDISVVCTHQDCENAAIRAIINADSRVDTTRETVRFALKPHKVFLFHREEQTRLDCTLR